MHHELPTGTVTFLFTDMEGSTRLLHELGAEAHAQALAEHRRLLREAFVRHGRVEVDTQGNAFFYVFPTAPGALRAARLGERALVPAAAPSVLEAVGVGVGSVGGAFRSPVWGPRTRTGSTPAAC